VCSRAEAIEVTVSSRCQFALQNVNVSVDLETGSDLSVAVSHCFEQPWLIESLEPSKLYTRTVLLQGPQLQITLNKKVTNDLMLVCDLITND
jgi:hypothetical protein